MAKETILIIEDEKNILELVQYNFEKEGYRVLTASQGIVGFDKARKEHVDLFILDWMLPDMDGLDICKSLRQNEKTSHIPILMLTAKSQETDKVVALELGADDYVTKPFSTRELAARAKALLRRTSYRPTEEVYTIGDLELDTRKHSVTIKSNFLQLTPKGYELLKILIEGQGRVLTREDLLNQVWGFDQSLNIETRTVDIHISKLRKELKSEAWRLITVNNVGYRFDHELS